MKCAYAHNKPGGIALPRCKKHRCCRSFGDEIVYKPIAVSLSETDTILIEFDEFEAMRLCDLDSLDQITAGERMGVSRGTIQRLLTSGRRKVVEALLAGRAIRIKNQEGVKCDEDLCPNHGE